jgi:hypothetical protein
MELKSNKELDLAYNFVEFTNRNVFLTGKAGTGKTTFLHTLRETSRKRMVVVAPTGVAAINAKGVTIHSFFQMPFGPIITERVSGIKQPMLNSDSVRKFNRKKIKIIKSLDLLVIDEISMVRADLLDGIDDVLRQYRNKNLPFGGVQLLMIGDLQQLAPVVKEDEWQMLRPYYDTVYFFSSRALRESNPINIELKFIFRQRDDKFIKILNEIRDDKLSEASMKELNKRYKPGISSNAEDGYITLTTHNASADRINNEQLSRIKGKEYTFIADVEGTFSEYSYPTDYELKLKKGAQVMFIKNDSSPEKLYYNGKIGKITAIDKYDIEVKCEGDDEHIVLHKEVWENVRYSANTATAQIEEDIIGSFTQYPLRLAWAITIHKSQGLTFEKAIIDAQQAFAHGQIYVALSRCKSLEGLILSSKILTKGIICDRQVISFNRNIEENPPGNKELSESKLEYQLYLLTELYNYKLLAYQFNRCKKILNENKTVVEGNLTETTDKILPAISELITVSGKFIKQVRHLLYTVGDAENNSQLQERIKKASQYFKEKTEQQIVAPLDAAAFETDNKTVRKSIKDILSKINEELFIKTECLNETIHKFRVYDYLDVRAKASLKPARIKLKKKVEVTDSTLKHPELYKKLQEWRKLVATEEDVPFYFVAHQKLLRQISILLPTTEKQLKAIKGMGSKKLKKYGKEILDIVLEYCEEKKIL